MPANSDFSSSSSTNISPSPIDMDIAYEAYKEYIKDYNPDNPKIALKISHILRTAKKSKQLAKALELSPLDIDLAELIGLLHDIGRFEQIRIYNTFSDRNSIDHGNFGCEVLFDNKDGIIRKFIVDDSFDDIIYTAIKNHNKFCIADADNMEPQTLIHSKIIRDSDKMDIFKTILIDTNMALYGKEDVSNDILSEAVFNDFMTNHFVDYSLSSGSAPDSLLCNFGYVYDINFPESHSIILDDGYLYELGQKVFSDKETQSKYKLAHQKAMEYCRENAR